MSSYSSVTQVKTASLFLILKKHSIDPADFLKNEGIDPVFLESPDNRINADDFYRILAKAAELTGDRHLGLHMGEIFTSFPNILGYVMMNCRTLGEAIRKYIKYQNITDTIQKTTIEEQANTRISLVFEKNAALVESTLACYKLAGFVTYGQALTGGKLKPEHIVEVRFNHSEPADSAEYRRIFPCPLLFNARENSLIMRRDSLDTPVINANPSLLTMFEHHAQEVLKNLSQDESYTAKVSRLLVEMLQGDAPRIEMVARELCLSVRSLQDKLKSEGTSYSSLLDRIRKDLAINYIKNKTVTFAEIAYLLGFSEPSVFHRSFKKWTNTTPGQYRGLAVQ